jgi:hypothetical protein
MLHAKADERAAASSDFNLSAARTRASNSTRLTGLVM